MSEKIEGNFKILFLFEDEIRKAAQSLDAFNELNNRPDGERDDAAWKDSISNALQACYTALHDAADKNFKLMLCEKSLFRGKA